MREQVQDGGRPSRVGGFVHGGVCVVVSAAAVVVLGLLADVAGGPPVGPGGPVGVVGPSGAVGPVAPVEMTARPGDSVWDVAHRASPAASGPQRAAVAERIVAENSLTSVRLRPGQVVRVGAG